MKKTFYSWECPPRKLTEEKWLNFEVDLDKVFSGIKLDEFTELPKIIEFGDIEKNLLKKIDQTYYKIIADTNAYYLSPETIKKCGEKRIKTIFNRFKRTIQKECNEKYGIDKVKVVLFTEIIKDYKEEYEKTFFNVLNSVNRYISQQEFSEIEKYLKEHVGFKKQKELEKFTKKVIASYIAEGTIIPKIFHNPVWINFDEPEILVNITNKCNKEKIEIINTNNNKTYQY